MVDERNMVNQNRSPARNWREFSVFGVLVVFWDTCVSWCSVLFWTAWLRLRLFLLSCSCGSGLRVDGCVVIRAPRRGAIQLGRGVRINSRFCSNLVGLATPTVLQCLGSGRILIGDYSGCSGAVFSARASIEVGQHVQIGGNVRVYDHDFHSLDHQIRRDPARDRRECNGTPVVIGDDVFIGANAVILKGVHIGERSVIGAGAVVALKEVPADSLVIGNPARIVRCLSRSDSSDKVSAL